MPLVSPAFSALFRRLCAVLGLACLALAPVPPAWSAPLHYALEVRIDPVAQVLDGRARLSSAEALTLDLDLPRLPELHLSLDGQVYAPAGDSLALALAPGVPVELAYTARLAHSESAFVGPDDVFLSGPWYPRPQVLAEYSLSLTLPAGFVANAEADAIEASERDGLRHFRFHFPYPLDGLNLAASRHYVLQQDSYRDIRLETYFFREDAALARTYLDYAKTYLALYERLLAPYPYKRFAIVEDRLPTGHAMPTYTLLGQSVARLPFIVQTSLGHEILHQWFGNYVYIDYAQGNWAEGLTHYLADHWYAEQEGQGAAYRKRILLDYAAYVNADNAFPLKDFRQRHDKAQSSVGYGKSAMLFHGLRLRYGDERFFQALRGLIQAHPFRAASWADLRQAFERAGGEDLGGYFRQWLERSDLPRIGVSDAQVRAQAGQLRLAFTLKQDAQPYALRLPLTIYGETGKTVHWLETAQAELPVSLPLDEAPVKAVLDEDYSLLRALDGAETPPRLAAALGRDGRLAAVPGALRATYQPLLEALGIAPEQIFDPAAPPERWQSVPLLLAGADNPLARQLIGKPQVLPGGFYLRVYPHPAAPGADLVFAQAANAEEAAAAARKLVHYGQYTELAFDGGRNTFKQTDAARDGLLVLERPPTRAVAPEQAPSLAEILPRLRDSRVIFVGEQHDRYVHHLNQLQVIRYLHESGAKIAVGLEMFQLPYQQALDEYLAGAVDEAEFLRRSRYFEKWRYDYHLYKPIVDYAKAQGIPLLALNSEGDISRKIGRQGLDSLSPEEKSQLPAVMDFSDARYREDLQRIFASHPESQEQRNFEYFLQAQVAWDETMAESARRYLEQHPAHKLVVLAGNGHLRYRYGIPQRLARRAGPLPYTVLVQDDDIAGKIADYVLLTGDLPAPQAPLLGVMLDDGNGAVRVVGVSPGSPAQRAGLEKDDVLTALAGQALKSVADLKIALFYAAPGQSLALTVQRQGQSLEKTVTLGDAPRE